jgi:hypothetical protein
MTSVQFLPFLTFSPCQSEFFRTVSVDLLPQYQEIQSFIKHHQCQDIGYHHDNDRHSMIVMIINHTLISLEHLEQQLLQQSQRAILFFYIAINKFLVYSNNNCTTIEHGHKNYDYKLVQYCTNILNRDFSLIKYNYCNDDNGKLGNFMHPVTTMFFQRHG